MSQNTKTKRREKMRQKYEELARQARERGDEETARKMERAALRCETT